LGLQRGHAEQRRRVLARFFDAVRRRLALTRAVKSG
jgi:hypothetical protein